VSYRGVPPAMADLFAGVVDFLNADLPVLRPFVRERRVVPLVIYGPTRSPQLPEVPSSAEAGMPALDMQNWYGILAPAGLPRPVFRQLEVAFAKARLDPEATPRFDEGGVGAPMGAAAFSTRLDAEFARWLPLVQRLGIKVE
jgi:tripartite-type tricarboxylate transporter receptor subunit TctC